MELLAAKICRFYQKNYMVVMFSLIDVEILEHQHILFRYLQ
jgi:hypothetical protein